MSATAFLRQRRAVAAGIIQQAFKRAPKRLAGILEEFGLSPTDLDHLPRNNDVLLIADRIAAEQLKQPELDDLEELNSYETGDRMNVHSPDVRQDQFENQLQHPCQETVGVGNMHDGPQAAESLVNVGSPEIDAAISEAVENGDMTEEDAMTFDHNSDEAFQLGLDRTVSRIEAAREDDTSVADDSLAVHAHLPEAAPSVAPAAQADHPPAATEDGTTDTPLVREKLEESTAAAGAGELQPTDPDHTQQNVAATAVDVEGAAAEVEKQVKAGEQLEKQGLAAIEAMDRDQLLSYAGKHGLDIGEIKERTTVKTISGRVITAAKEKGLIDG